MSNDISSNLPVSSSLMVQEKSGINAALHPSESVNPNDLATVKKVASETPEKKENDQQPSISENNSEEISQQVQKLLELSKGWSVNYSIDQDSGKTVIKIIDGQTDEVIRQMPSEEWLAVSKKIIENANSVDNDALPGLLFDRLV